MTYRIGTPTRLYYLAFQSPRRAPSNLKEPRETFVRPTLLTSSVFKKSKPLNQENGTREEGSLTASHMPGSEARGRLHDVRRYGSTDVDDVFWSVVE